MSSSRADRIIELGDDRVLVLERQIGRGKTSGVVVEHEHGWLFTLRDGKLVRWLGYWDRAESHRSRQAAGVGDVAAETSRWCGASAEHAIRTRTMDRRPT